MVNPFRSGISVHAINRLHQLANAQGGYLTYSNLRADLGLSHAAIRELSTTDDESVPATLSLVDEGKDKAYAVDGRRDPQTEDDWLALIRSHRTPQLVKGTVISNGWAARLYQSRAYAKHSGHETRLFSRHALDHAITIGELNGFPSTDKKDYENTFEQGVVKWANGLLVTDPATTLRDLVGEAIDATKTHNDRETALMKPAAFFREITHRAPVEVQTRIALGVQGFAEELDLPPNHPRAVANYLSALPGRIQARIGEKRAFDALEREFRLPA